MDAGGADSVLPFNRTYEESFTVSDSSTTQIKLDFIPEMIAVWGSYRSNNNNAAVYNATVGSSRGYAIDIGKIDDYTYNIYCVGGQTITVYAH